MTSCGVFVAGIGISGGTNVIFEHALNARSNGYEVTFVTDKKVVPERDVKWHRIGRAEGFRWITKAEAQRCAFDVAMSTYWPTCFELHYANARRWVYFIQSLESRFPERHDYFGRTGPEATYQLPIGLITETGHVQDYIERFYGRKVHLAVNGVNKTIFRPEGARERKTNANSMRVLIEGSLEPARKGTVEAIGCAVEAGVEDLWLLTLNDITSYPGVSRVFSNVPIDDVGEIYRSCDLLLKLSRVEGMSGPPLEMFHCGGTSVLYGMTGCEHYARHGENCLIAPVADRARIVEYLRDLMRWPQLLSLLRDGAVKTARSWPSWEVSSRAFWEAVSNAAEDSRSTKAELQRYSAYFHRSARVDWSLRQLLKERQ